MFYEIFIRLWIFQIKNFQTIIKRLPPNIVEKKQAEIPTSHRINILNWITPLYSIFLHIQGIQLVEEGKKNRNNKLFLTLVSQMLPLNESHFQLRHRD